MKLTPKHGLFIAEYLVDFNSTRAALAVGVPARSASVTGSRWLKMPAVQAAIAQRQAMRVVPLEKEAAELDRELMRVALADVGRLFDENGVLLPIHQLDEDTRRAISMVEDETTEGACFVTTRKRRIKMGDKLRALELSLKRRGLLGDSAVSAEVQMGATGLPADSSIKIVLVRPASE
jgi:phage terminase small subunit